VMDYNYNTQNTRPISTNIGVGQPGKTNLKIGTGQLEGSGSPSAGTPPRVKFDNFTVQEDHDIL